MHHTPPNLKTDRVSAKLLSRVIYLTLLATLAPPGVNAYYCAPGASDFNSIMAGLDTSGNACGQGKWNEGCGYGCDDAWAGTYISSSGSTTNSASCSSGQTSGSGQYFCNTIPSGYHATTVATTPQPCKEGFYALGSSTSYKCTVCPAGYYCYKGDETPLQITGYTNYQIQGKSYRSAVLPGYYINGNALPPIPCASKGYYWVASSGSCTICPAGSACPSSTMTTVIACASGLYSDQTGQFDCTACEKGKYCTSTQSLDCSAGYYSLGYQSVCTICPPGYYCPTASAPPVLCPSGTTSTGQATTCLINNNGLMSTNIASSQTSVSSTCGSGQYYIFNGTNPVTRCNDCPIGHYCSSTTSPPTPCASGWYSNTVGANVCIQCPAGSACAFPHTLPAVCPNNLATNGVNGYTSAAGSTSCYPTQGTCATGEYIYPEPSGESQICPAGYACNYCYAAPTLCPRGYHSAAGAIECTLCLAGYKCPSPYTSMVEACTTGYYSAAGSLNCYPIPDHMTTVDTATRPGAQWCKYGEYSALTANNCQICSSLQECLSDSIAPIDCPMSDDDTAISAFTSVDYELSCFPRLASRGGGDYTATASASFDELVDAGDYSQSGGTHHFDCPKGRECLFPMENIFIQCPPGTYDVDGYFACQPCPEGKVCPIMQKQYIEAFGGQVQSRFFSPYNTHAELMIPAGWWTDAANDYMIRPCALGYYSADGATGGCTICPIGYTCPIASNEPIRCDEGGVSLTQGSHECVPCLDDQWFNPITYQCDSKPDNTFAIHPIFAVQACNYNEQSDSTTFPDNDVLDCYETDATYYQITTNSYLTCPSGFYCLHSGWAQTYTKFPCPPGTYTSGTTGLDWIQDQCTYCPAGSYCPGGAYGQVTCPAGYICPIGTQFATQFPCPLATMQQTTGASTYTECGGCTSGLLCLEGTNDPFDCPPGENCALAPWLSGDCASGTYSNSGICDPCPAGQYCSTSSSYGIKCPSGTYNPSTGGKSVSDCLQATANYPVPKYGQTAVPTDYPVYLGYVYPLGTAFSHSIPCPAGQTCDTNTLARAWSDCPVDYACPQGSSTSTAEMCERGYDCPTGTLDSRQFPQASGYFTRAVGDTPEECTAGFYCPTGTQRPRHCPLGFYCEAGTKDYRDTPCPIGTYGENIELTDSNECTTCPAGRYCQPGLPQPQLCPAGTFSTGSADSAFTTSGLGYSTPCTLCTEGYYCPLEGTEAALECGLGFFSPEGSMICFSCYAGHLCDSTTTTQTYMEANKCDGVECITYAIYELSTSCPVGYYCDEDEFKPLPCPVGTYQDDTVSQSDVGTCVNVPAGYYNDEVGQNFTQIEVKLCSPGYICAAGSISRYAAPCPPAEYQIESGQSTCDTCPAGYYCLGATAHPIPCPGGYWCVDGVFEPTACSIGTYGANTMLIAESECTTCTKGSYCAEPGIQAPTGLCNAGFYCEAGSSVPEETDCPTGGYCEQGSFEKTYCPAGYYNEYANMKAFQDCVLCTPGEYCDGSTTDSTSGLCSAGWFCLSGSRVIDQYPAEPGYYTEAGASEQVECPAKEYNPLYYQSVCSQCPAGFYCDQTAMTEPTICTIGKYCEAGYETPVQCPVGTYNPVTGGTSIATHCLDCPPGRYCADKGLSAPSGDCAAGYFCLEASETSRPAALDTISGRWGKCPEGHYCPSATSYPYPCPAGTFSTSESLDLASECTSCTEGSYCETRGLIAVTGPCDEGFYCPTGESEPRNDLYKCEPGYYCPEGSSTQTLCEAGTYQHQYYSEACIVCPAGYYCLEGVTDPVICPAGAFCMESSTDFEPCTIGKYMPDTGASSDCLACTAGEYCGTTGLTSTTGFCDAGYVCTQLAYTNQPSSTSQGGYKCQQGYYCPSGSGFQLQCPPGKACPNTGMTDGDMNDDATYDCAAGYYCLIGAIKTTPLSEGSQGGDKCTTGHYCPQQTSVPIPCEPGTYLGTRGGTISTDCLPCPAGSYCQNYGSTTFTTCDEGWYCETGAVYGEVSGTPWDSINGVPKVCEVGFYCTSGIKTACSSKYQDQIGQNSCKSCPAGFQCTTEALIECGQSNYCPSGDMNPTRCATGYYTFKTTAISSTECKICPAGSYCTCTLDSGNGHCTDDTTVTACPAGFFCEAGSSDGNTACTEGNVCPEGTYEEVPCPPGYYCDGTGNTVSTMLDCPAGSYCTGGSTSSTYLTCSAGYYCELNSQAMYPCEIGTYNPSTGQVDVAGCLACPTGSTCTTRAQVADDITGFSCDSGYYCEDDSSKEQCPKGYYCPTDSIVPTPCAVGFYTDNLAQASCNKCPAGYYCGDDVLDEWISTATKILADSATPCMAGQYCPKKSYMLVATSLAGTSCPVGTFNPDVGARNVGDCIDCPEGYLCATSGLSGDYTTLTICPAGSYCPGASISKKAIVCPVGAYCPEGSIYYIECSVGTYNLAKSGTADTDCQACDPDYYCGSKGIGVQNSLQLCGDGYLCVGGNTQSTPMSTTTSTGEFCPAGYFCSRVLAGQQDCPIGTYQPNMGQSSCIDCPEGQLCDETNLEDPKECPIGNYCPAETNSVTNEAIPCPAGYYSDITNIGDADLCVPCEPGKYCLSGSTARSDAIDCDETFFCPLGASAGNSYTETYVFGGDDSGICPAGYNCPAGTLAPVPCEVGTWQELTGQTTCDPCTQGYYCDQVGLDELTSLNECNAGYYCLEGSHIPNPQTIYESDGTTVKTASSIGDLCSAGNYCPKGSYEETECLAGTYEIRTGSDECQECPAGYYCEVGCFKPIECKNGFCPAGSAAPTLCEDGTYGNEQLKKLEEAEDCPSCPNGKYCHSGYIQSDCDAGYFCDFGASAWQDEDKICEEGHYCPSGTLLPIRCPETLYWAGTGARDVSYCEPCQAGYYCLDNDSVSRVCPKGHFCPEKTKEPIPCWEGFYNPYKRQGKNSDCLICPIGSSCNTRGIDDYLRHMCPPGHYCPKAGSKLDPTPCPAGTFRNSTGAEIIGECWDCPAGHFCEEASEYATPCDAGYYCTAKSIVQLACTPGYYCPSMSVGQTICPKGYHCPTYRTDIYSKCGNGTYCGLGAKQETSCANGEFGTSVTFNWNRTVSCIPCGPGQYSDSKSRTCEPCEAGYVCFQGATTSRPNSPQENGQICDPGFYCLKASYSGIACPIGTYSADKGNGQLNQCKPCPVDTFGNEVGQTSCQACEGGTVAEIGQSTCKCVGLNRKYLAQTKQCVCLSGFQPVDGSDSLQNGFSDCQKNVYERCTSDEERDIQGNCRPKDDCAAECNGGTGTIQQNFGICQCDNIVTAAQICNLDCQDSALVTTFTSEGKVRIYDPITKNTTETDMPQTIGSAKCSEEDQTRCELVGVGMTSSSSGAFEASYNLPDSLIQNNATIASINNQTVTRRKNNSFKGVTTFLKSADNDTLFWFQSGRNLQDSNGRNLQDLNVAGATVISNPVVCASKGSAVLFDSLSASTYPVYQKDSLLNTNQEFDYGAFNDLPDQLVGLEGQNFIFNFDQSGVYVFADSRNPSKLMIISVMHEDHKCPADSKFSPMTYASLLKVGAYQNDVLLPPDWAFFFITLIAFILLIVLAVLLVSWIARRDWKQKTIPKILYQTANYKAVERDDPSDNRAIVSINTDSSSFMFRAQGHDDGKDMGERLVDRMKTGKSGKTKVSQNQGPRGRKDLSLNQVETLKDALHKHLKEIKKLRALRYGKDGTQVQDELGNEQSDYTSSDEDELNSTIANVKKLIANARAVLRGEGEDEIQIFTEDTKMIEAINTADDKRAEREEAIRLRKEKLEEEQKQQDEKFKRKINFENDIAIHNLEDMKNKVLEMQVESAYDRGKGFQERMLRSGHKDEELGEMMGQLEGKMQRVEDLLLDDKDRQNEMLKRQLEQRRLRRRKLNEKLVEVDEQLHKNEYQEADKKTVVVKELQEELKVEIEALDQDDVLARENVQRKYDAIKVDKLADYQDRLRNAGGSKDFQMILNQFQEAQIVVDKELKRQIDKENDRLDRDLKARKAKAKAQAEIRRSQKFKDLEIEQAQHMTNQLDGKAKIEEALSTNERKDEIMNVFTNRLKQQVNEGNLLTMEMERKRREEETLRQEHERKQRKVQAEAMKDAAIMNKDVDDEIERIASADGFEPFQALVNERSNLQKQIAAAGTDDEKNLLLKQLKEVDEQVKNQLGNEAKDQDMALKRRLDARRLRRETAIEKEKVMKESLLQDRITYALENSTAFAVYRNDLTNEAFNKIVNEMKLELTPEEIPAAIENLVDDKHQKELSDWLLKLYEQKAIELKEEILTLMEEKIAKQQVLKQNFADRKRGIDAILSKTSDPAAIKELTQRKEKLNGEMLRDVNKLETDFVTAETRKTREIQARSMDRETKALQDMSEMHFDEKKKIFEQYLPDSLMKDLFEELGTKEREQMNLYQKELEAVKQAKLKEMEEDERQLKAELANQQSILNKLSDEEQILAKKEMIEQRRQKQDKRQKYAVVSSQDVISKIRQDMEKGLEGLSGAYEEEHKRQLAMMEARLASRGQQVSVALEQKKLEQLRKQEQADLEHRKELDKVRELRKRKAQLLDTIQNGQKLMLKGCYSRPLYNYNKKLHDAAVKNDDISQLLSNQSFELKEQVMGRLLTKVSELEEKVSMDVNRKPDRNSSGFHTRLTSRAGGVNEVQSNTGSDKVANAKALLSNLFKKKV